MLNLNNTASKSIALVRANSLDLLEIVKETSTDSTVSWHLFDNKDGLEEAFKKLNFEWYDHRISIHHTESDEEAANAAAALIQTGQANILMKGIISTNTILKSVLNKSLKLLDQPLLSHIALFKLPSYHKPLIISDAAMNINPDEQMKISIIDNALRVAEKIGVTEPKVALISAVEKVNPKIESTVINQSIADNHHFKNAVVEGPMSYDLALSKAAAEVKSYESKVAGDVDILIMPNIDAGNVLYKALTISAGAHVAGLIIGLKAPFVLTSRADSKDEKLNSLKLAFQLLT